VEIIKYHQQSGTVRRYNDAEFLICNYCFWCATILSNAINYEKCPSCKRAKMESIPLSVREAYSINTENENLSVEFWNLTN